MDFCPNVSPRSPTRLTWFYNEFPVDILKNVLIGYSIPRALRFKLRWTVLLELLEKIGSDSATNEPKLTALIGIICHVSCVQIYLELL